jgi:hypothetical protein
MERPTIPDCPQPNPNFSEPDFAATLPLGCVVGGTEVDEGSGVAVGPTDVKVNCRQSVARTEDKIVTSGRPTLDPCKQAMQEGALAEKVGHRHPKVVEHAVAAAIILEQIEEQAGGWRQRLVNRELRAEACVAFAVARHELHAAPLIKTVGQIQ